MKSHGTLFKCWCLVISLSMLVCPMSQSQVLPTAAAILSAAEIQQQPPVMRGLRLDPDNPLNIEFLFDLNGQEKLDKADIDRMIKYFLAGLTVPEDKLWVNLSPKEKDKILPSTLNSTDLGNDLIRQDYMLKQLGTALTYPETKLGQEYWTEINAQMSKTGNKNGQVDLFNKLWIVPESAAVYERGNTVLVTEAKLKTMLDQDYRLMSGAKADAAMNNFAMTIAKNKILPVVNKDVNESKMFAPLRQIYSSLILAQWFKAKLRESFYNEYINKEKTGEVSKADPQVKERMFQRYVDSFMNGVYNYVREEPSEGVNRQYYSGGIEPVADLTIGKKLRIATDEEASRISKVPLLGILAGLSFKKRGKRTDNGKRFYKRLKAVVVVGVITAIGILGIGCSQSNPVAALPDKPDTTQVIPPDTIKIIDTVKPPVADIQKAWIDTVLGSGSTDSASARARAFSNLMASDTVSSVFVPRLTIYVGTYVAPPTYDHPSWTWYRETWLNDAVLDLLTKIHTLSAAKALIKVGASGGMGYKDQAVKDLLTFGKDTLDAVIPDLKEQVMAGNMELGANALVGIGSLNAQTAMLDCYGKLQAAGKTGLCYQLLEWMINLRVWWDIHQLKVYLANETDQTNQLLLRQIIVNSGGTVGGSSFTDTNSQPSNWQNPNQSVIDSIRKADSLIIFGKTSGLSKTDDNSPLANDYGGIAINKVNLQHRSTRAILHLGNIEPGEFDGVGFEYLGSRKIKLGDLLNQ